MKEQPPTENNVIIIQAILQDEECCRGCPCLEYEDHIGFYVCVLFLDEMGSSTELKENDVGDPIRLQDCKHHFLKHNEAAYPPPPPAWIAQQLYKLKREVERREDD